jgi:hypothetical protein
LIQLVENGMPLPHEKEKKEKSSATVYLLLVRIEEGAEKITGKSMYFARKETCGNKNSELLYIVT